MKTLIAVLVAAGLGFAASYYFIAQDSSAKLSAEQAAAQAAAAKIQELNVALSNANLHAARVILAAPPYAISSEEVLQRLALIDPSTPELRPRKIREIIHNLEYLVDAGTNSFLPIRHFIATGKDVSYAFDEGRAVSPAPTFWNWHPGMELRSGLVLPPSLRISLVDVLRYIGGDDAAASLGWMLTTSARGMEIPYIALALDKLAPGQYTDLALQAAKSQLQASLTNTAPSRADQLGNGYVLNWLASRGDTSMVPVARQTLVDSQGNFNPEAARYLVSALKGDAMDDLGRVYNNNAGSDTKNRIANMAFDYVGSSQSANAIFSDWLLGNDVEGAPGSINARPRELALRLLGGGRYGPFNASAPTDPNVINNRIGFLEGIRPNLGTQRLQQAADQTIAVLRGLPGASR